MNISQFIETLNLANIPYERRENIDAELEEFKVLEATQTSLGDELSSLK